MTPRQFVEICFLAFFGMAFLLFGPWEEGSLTPANKFLLLLGLVFFFAATLFILHH